jgi:CubicO group peptidase (beta-lactamase class C family)
MTVSIAYIDKKGQKQEKVVEAKNKIKIYNLLNHTSGLTYGTFGNSFAKKRLKSSEISKLNLKDINLKQYVKELAKFPLAYNPNTVWEYGRSIEVLGRVIELASNKTLDIFLKDKIFKPLDMKDTSFYVDQSKWHRIAEPFKDKQPKLINIRDKPNFLTGGHGLVSTIDDYMKFCMMFLKKGKVNDNSILSRKTVEYMTSNHLGYNISRDTTLYLPGPGYGFGLGFAVRESNGLSSWPGSKGEFFWAGYAGTYFWIDPKEELIVISMTQSVTNRMKFRLLLRNLVYQAIIN